MITAEERHPWTKEFPEVAHYTTAEGILGILASKTLWATHYRFLNDYSELEHGKRYVTEIYQEVDKSMSNIFKGRPQELEKLWWNPLAPNNNDPEFFVTSFCGIPKDKPDLGRNGLLSQWRGYGRNGSFAIIFDSLKLAESYFSFAKKCKEHRDCSYGCVDCLIHFFAHLFINTCYIHDFNIIKNDFTKIYEAIKNHAQQHIKDHQDCRKNFNKEGINDYIKAIIYLLLVLKSEFFIEENEIRFACLNRYERRGKDHHNQSPYDIINEGQKPRLKIDFPHFAIKRILIGPQPNQGQMKMMIKYQLEKYGYDAKIEIIESRIPFIP